MFSKPSSSSFKVFITLVAQIWVAVVGILMLPIYVRYMGVESYGLVAFFTTLTSSLAILDLGLSAAVSRQLAMMKGGNAPLSDQRSLLYSVEVIYWIVALALGGIIILCSSPIAEHWVNSKELSINVIRNAVILMGCTFAFQWPMSVYTGTLIGLQKQEQSAALTIFYTTLRAGIILIALHFIDGTIESFFLAYTFAVAIQTFLVRKVAWDQIKLPNHRPRFSKVQLQKVKKFALGMAGISLVTFMLSQLDKIVVSKLVYLEFVGYYNLAFTLSNIMTQVAAPLQVVFFPKFSSMVASGHEDLLANTFHVAARWVSVIVFPVGMFLVFFSYEILTLWTGNLKIAANTAPLLRNISIGTICNCLMWVPYYYMLARGNTRYSIWQNIIASIVMTPLLIWLVLEHGTFGASLVWLTVNAGYVLISIPLFHYLYFKGHLSKWYINNLFLPFITAAPLFLLTKWMISQDYFELSYLSFTLSMMMPFAIYALLTKEIRLLILNKWSLYTKSRS